MRFAYFFARRRRVARFRASVSGDMPTRLMARCFFGRDGRWPILAAGRDAPSLLFRIRARMMRFSNSLLGDA